MPTSGLLPFSAGCRSAPGGPDAPPSRRAWRPGSWPAPRPSRRRRGSGASGITSSRPGSCTPNRLPRIAIRERAFMSPIEGSASRRAWRSRPSRGIGPDPARIAPVVGNQERAEGLHAAGHRGREAVQRRSLAEDRSPARRDPWRRCAPRRGGRRGGAARRGPRMPSGRRPAGRARSRSGGPAARWRGGVSASSSPVKWSRSTAGAWWRSCAACYPAAAVTREACRAARSGRPPRAGEPPAPARPSPARGARRGAPSRRRPC